MATDKIKVAVRVRPFNRRGTYAQEKRKQSHHLPLTIHPQIIPSPGCSNSRNRAVFPGRFRNRPCRFLRGLRAACVFDSVIFSPLSPTADGVVGCIHLPPRYGARYRLALRYRRLVSPRRDKEEACPRRANAVRPVLFDTRLPSVYQSTPVHAPLSENTGPNRRSRCNVAKARSGPAIASLTETSTLTV